MFTALQNTIETVALDMIQVSVLHHLDRRGIAYHRSKAEVTNCISGVANTMAIMFSARVLGERLPPLVLSDQPASVWQMFKRDYMPDWFNRRFPVISTHLSFDVTAFYPRFRVKLPEQEHYFQVRAQ